MPTTNIAPYEKQRFFDAVGLPLAGGKLFTYAAGTTTKQNSYTDSTGATPNTNPIILDAAGYCNLWLDQSLTYKLTLSPSTDTDPPTNPIWTVDNLNSASSPLAATLAAAGGAASVGFTQATAAAAGTVGAKLQQIMSITDAPNSALPSATDNSTAINAAIATMIALSPVGAVYIPHGNFNITNPISINGGVGTHTGFMLYGAGEGSVIQNNGTGNGINLDTAGGVTERVTLRDFSVFGTSSSGTGVSIGTTTGVTGATLEHLRIDTVGKQGIYAYSGAQSTVIRDCLIKNTGLAAATTYPGIHFASTGSTWINIEDTQVNTGTYHGIWIVGALIVNIIGCNVDAQTNAGIDLVGCQGVSITGTYSGTLMTNAYVIEQNCQGVSIDGCWADAVSNLGFVLDTTQGVSINGCYVDQCASAAIGLTTSNDGLSITNNYFLGNATAAGGYNCDIFANGCIGGVIEGNFFDGHLYAGGANVNNHYAVNLISCIAVGVRHNSSTHHATSTVNIASSTNVISCQIGPNAGIAGTYDPALISCSDGTDPVYRFSKNILFDMPNSGAGAIHTGRTKIPGVTNIRQVVAAYSASITVDLNAGGQVWIQPSNGTAFTITNPINFAIGDEFELLLYNQTGGALGTITWGTTYKLGSGYFVTPANGTLGIYRFMVLDGNNTMLMSAINGLTIT